MDHCVTEIVLLIDLGLESEVYKNSSLKLLNELDGPEFTVEDIEGRENRLLGFIGERWR